MSSFHNFILPVQRKELSGFLRNRTHEKRKDHLMNYRREKEKQKEIQVKNTHDLAREMFLP
jgi:hypothetical protein